MNLFVIEFASKSINCIFETICLLFGKLEINIQVLTNEHAEEFDFQDWDENLTEAFNRLESGELSAIQISTKDQNLLLATIYCPKFIGEGIDEYTCISELEGSLSLAESVVSNIFSSITGLTYLSLSLEESLEINENTSFKPDSFPWDDWRLVLGSSNNQELKKGAAYKRLQN